MNQRKYGGSGELVQTVDRGAWKGARFRAEITPYMAYECSNLVFGLFARNRVYSPHSFNQVCPKQGLEMS